jgi:hypothetical protein
MPSKKTFISVIIVFIAVLSFLAFIFFRNRPVNTSEPLKAIPLDAAFIIRINDFRSLMKNIQKDNKIWEELRKLSIFSRMDQQMGYLEFLNSNYPVARELLLNEPSYISAHYTGRGGVSFIYFYKLPKGLGERKINELISKLLINSGTITQRKYEGRIISDVRLLDEDAVRNFSYTVTDGLFILSFSSILLEDAIRQLDLPGSIVQQAGFKEVLSTAGKNVDANLFLNFKNLPKAVSTCINQKYKSKVRSYDYFASWAELDINIKENMVLLNGFTHFSDTANYTANLFVDQYPQKLYADNILPSFISSFLAITLSDINTYFKDYKDYLDKLGSLNKYLREINLIKNKYNIDIIDELESIFDKEIVVAMDNSRVMNEFTDTYIILGTKSKSLSEKKLLDILKKVAQKNSVKVDNLTYSCKVDNDLSYPVYNLPLKNLTGTIFGELFNINGDTYFTFIDNYVVFGNSVKSLSKFIINNVLKKTIVTNEAYREYKNNLSPRSSVYFYANLGRSSADYAMFLTDEIFNGWEENIRLFQKVQIFGFQLTPNNDLIYNNVFIKYISGDIYSPHTVWESRLDTIIDFKPQFVKNHYNQQSEIFVQDLKNNIYLVNNAGRILWKVNINERITSKIYQVDYYKNSKLQIMFSTKNSIHLIDRNGNYVERYPVKLRSPATNGMSLFDYDNNKNYRIFIACEDKHIYAYTKDGTMVSGWNFDKTESEVNQDVNHFRIENKDFIVFGDRYRTYILDRKGNVRVNIQEIFPRSLKNNYILDEKDNLEDSRIVITDTAGIVYFIYFNGKIGKLKLGEFTCEHFFDYKDVDGDGNRDFIFLDKEYLKVFKHDKTKLFDYNFGEEITVEPVYYYFSYSDRKLGVVSKSKNLIYLINNDGSVYKGFPLRGCTLFSIGYFSSATSRFNLIVGSDENFLLNYIVQ